MKVTTGKKNLIGVSLIYIIIFALITTVFLTVFKPWKFEMVICKKDFWISYGFLTAAFIFQFASLFLVTYKKKNGADALFLGLPLILFSGIYFVIELIVSVVFMLLAAFEVKTPITLVAVLQIVILGTFLIGAIIAVLTKNTISAIEEKNKRNVTNIRNLTSGVELAANMCSDSEVKRLLVQFSEDIRYSDPMSRSEVMTLDNKISSIVSDIQVAVTDNNLEEVKRLVAQGKMAVLQRNQILANSK